MSEGADLRDTSTLMAAKAVLVKSSRGFATAMEEAISDAERFGMWIESAGPSEWERQLRQRTDRLNMARSALYRKQMQPTADGRPPSVVDEKRALQRAEQAVEEAQQRLRALKRWSVEYQRVLGRFRAGLSPLANHVEGVLPRSIAAINRMAEAIDAYLATQSGGPAQRALDADLGAFPDPQIDSDLGDSMRRGGSEQGQSEGQRDG
jgi:hypothetical protein